LNCRTVRGGRSPASRSTCWSTASRSRHAEVVVIDEEFGLRVTELVAGDAATEQA
jgi:hypothetical protein